MECSVYSFKSWVVIHNANCKVVQLTIPLKEVRLNFGNFLPGLFPRPKVLNMIASLFEGIWVSNWIWGLFKGRESLPVNFSFLSHEITKLRPQRMTVESSEVC